MDPVHTYPHNAATYFHEHSRAQKSFKTSPLPFIKASKYSSNTPDKHEKSDVMQNLEETKTNDNECLHISAFVSVKMSECQGVWLQTLSNAN